MATISGLSSSNKDDFIEINCDASDPELNNLPCKVHEIVLRRFGNFDQEFVDFKAFIAGYITLAKRNSGITNIKEFSNTLIGVVNLVARNNFPMNNLELVASDGKISQVTLNGSIVLDIDYQELKVQIKCSEVDSNSVNFS